MECIALKKIERKDSLIYYINEYHGILEYNFNNQINEKVIEIIFEKNALGTTNIQLHIDDDILKENIKDVEEFIYGQYKQGLFE